MGLSRMIKASVQNIDPARSIYRPNCMLTQLLRAFWLHKV